ncbi:four helix bundle protein [Flavobacterium muglaense]|uniref:Four helix bundle protein n=1 Tax=Flavobacterium muglaense TaxID=2764716 RepID=A0A923MZV0_9FLAO|nr:four helix bundle protein [Flavobacterium muglaense]MBC5837499.1 four helix bundle protein [Flavobacterium muglaense]MBC5844084.1 four helix bundle protein [Flavobacterium muglaense]
MYKELMAYQKAFKLAMQVFEVSKAFPKEERYALTDQIRRSSRSVCANIANGYRKRLYEKHFIAKISDADMENSETTVWLDFAVACNNLTENTHQELLAFTVETGKLLGYRIQNPEKFSKK